VAIVDPLEKELAARDPDVRLMLQVRDDVPGAFEALMERYQSRLLGIMGHLAGSVTEAEDLAQDVFLRIYRARKGYRPKAKFSTWLFTIANNVALNHRRGKVRHASVALPQATDSTSLRPGADQRPGSDPTASTQMRQAELATIVREALDELGDDQKVAVLLSKFEEMSYAEIGEVMGKTEAAIKSLLARARMNLRERLEPYLRTGQRGS
jgi:RNA polymerase sigma-70 factor (ECF subfamily)